MQHIHVIALRRHRVPARAALIALAVSLFPLAGAAQPADASPAAEPAAQEAPAAVPEPALPQGTLDRVRLTGRLNIAYRTDARPLSFRDEAGKPAGYTVELCRHVAEAVKAELRLATLDVQWLPVAGDAGIEAVRAARADLLCADRVTLTAREQVSFSTPVFPAGVGALLRADAPQRLRDVLAQRTLQNQPLWRGSAAVLEQRTFVVEKGSPAADWVAARIGAFKLIATVVQVDSVDEGIRKVLEGDADVLFGERNILLDAANRSSGADSLAVIDRQYTIDPLAIGLARYDEDLRLVVDRALSRVLRSDGFDDLYSQWFGTPDPNVALYFRANALPE